jgi:lipopolysaccharide transport system permease protein
MSLLKAEVHWQASREILSLLTRHRKLTVAMARREFLERHAGQVLGPLWALLHPLAAMAVYLFIFGFVFRVRITRTDGLPFDYVVYLLSGLIPWLAFQDAMGKGATTITANANLVKQVVFPLEVLPVKTVLTTLLPPALSFTLLTAYCALRLGALPWTLALLPLLLLVQGLGMIGVAFALAPIGAYFRDLREMVQVFGTLGVYLVPAFYLPEMVPGFVRPLLYANPFSYMIWAYQDACYYGRFEHPWAWMVFGLLSATAFYLGYRVFRKLKPYFGNVL